MTTFTLAEQTRIDELYRTGERFFSDILGMSIRECLITDLSMLSDFGSCGLPDELIKPSMSSEEIRAIWTQWVIQKIRHKYGITLDSTMIILVDLFDQIRKVRELH